MLTALISLLSGLMSGVVPSILKEVVDSRASAREREFLKLQHQLEMERMKVGADMKIRESESAIIAEEMRATREHLTAIIETQGKPTGIPWLDGFNASLRPLMLTGIMLLFFWIAIIYVHGVMGQYYAGRIDVMTLERAVFGSIVGESIIGALSFLFGYRSGRKVVG